ncbi:MAG: GNAT family N-acetyltransferase [Anaerolineae bacterium]|jgi:ribosomal protein S18 acetylase RimI-like enzyme|nr:GNAT family N-acetyltransferase [Anaerolineae bacterium]MDH7473189.1 GNAT family N-acetyltransferase [Anaerolineae bacterium]
MREEERFVTKKGLTVILRPAVEADAPSLLAALNSVAAEEKFLLRSRFDRSEWADPAFIRQVEQAGNLLLVAVYGGQVIGWLALSRGAEEYIHHTADLMMGIISGYRGQGLGSAMLDYALGWAREQGVEKIYISLRSGNEKAFPFYAKHGFIEEGRHNKFIKTGEGCYEDFIVLARLVAPEAP